MNHTRWSGDKEGEVGEDLVNECIRIVRQKYAFRDDKVLFIYAKLVGGPLPLLHFSYLVWITMEYKNDNWNYMSEIRLPIAA